MKQVSIDPQNLPQELCAGVQELCAHEGFCQSETGVRILAARGQKFCARSDGRTLQVEYTAPCQFFRALSYLKTSACFSIARAPAFEHNGAMIDCSRNAVPTVEAVEGILRKMALMGLDTLMLYTEDTYEIPEYPYFGYLRGRFSPAELRRLDRYALGLGVELVPCIQTLAHLERALHWTQVDPDLRDTNDILMVGEEKTYELIDRMFGALHGCFTTKRIHIGMDEAFLLGHGNFRFKNKIVPPHELMARHLSRVCEIARRYGMQPMIWSDMYLRAASPSGLYYDVPETIPPAILDAAPPDVPLVYWDYSHNEYDDYARLIRAHRQFRSEILFAGGLWTWVGPAPCYSKMRTASASALRACEDYGIRSVFATAWGDNGGETSPLAALYGMQLYAEYDYAADISQAWLAERFAACTGENPDAFAALDAFNTVEGIQARKTPPYPANSAKFLLYQDPLVPLFAADTAHLTLSGHYDALCEFYAGISSDTPCFEAMYRFYEQLARLLAVKCRWHEQAPAGTPQTAKALAALAVRCAQEARACKTAWETLWMSTNKPYGFEILDLRMSALAGRFETAARQMEKLARGEENSLETLFCPKLRCLSDDEGKFNICVSWSDCVSACNV